MRFSRYKLDQLAKVNSMSINTLISKQKELHALHARRGVLQANVKEVTSSKKGTLAKGSSLLMGRIDTRLLIKLGYSDIGALILEMEENDENIKRVNDQVKDIDQSIASSIIAVEGIDVTKDMTDQITQEIILDSDIEEVKANSSEILLMLSQSKGAADIYKQAEDQIKKNEEELTDILTGVNSTNKKIYEDSSLMLDQLNTSTEDINNKLDQLSGDKIELTTFEKTVNYLNRLSTTKKNVILGTTFFGFLLIGVGGKGKPKSDDKSKNKDV